MRYQQEFGQLLALAVAIHRRDEVATVQWIKRLADCVVNDHEEAELKDGRNMSKTRKAEKLSTMFSDRFKPLSGLVDADGMAWLKSQIKD